MGHAGRRRDRAHRDDSRPRSEVAQSHRRAEERDRRGQAAARVRETRQVTSYIALLRAVNVAGHNPLAMYDLRELFTDLGFTSVQSLLQSGNVVFQSSQPAGAALEGRLENETQKRLDVAADYIVRSGKQWAQIVAANPFPRQAKTAPNQLVVMVLKSAARAANVHALQAAIQGPETLQGGQRCLYILYPEGIGRSKLTGAQIEKKLGVRGTARNWNTVLKLAALANS